MAAAGGVLEFLRGQPVIVLFLLLGCGYLLGRIKVYGIAPGPVIATLLIGLVLGYFGFRMSPGAQAVGFALFIFSVGYQAGPRFVEVVKVHGLRYFSLALFVVGLGFITSWIAGRLLHLPVGGTAGLLAGALTSAATLAAAQEALRAGVVALPAGWTVQAAITSIGTCYAITYVVGTVGAIALVTVFPRLIGLDLAEEARLLEAQSDQDPREPLQARAYRVENAEFTRATIGELSERLWDGLAMVRVRRGLEWLTLAAQEHLRIGDEIYAYGYARFFRQGIDRAGPEIRILGEMELSASLGHVVIARKGAVGRTLRELDLARSCGLVVCDVKRDGYTIPVTRDLVLQRGDVLTVVGPAWGLKSLPDILGPVEVAAIETDMTTFAFGIAVGAALGLLTITIGGIPLTLGMAGGLLLTGIGVGWLNAARPTIGRFPDAARWVLMEFGLLIFIAGIGLASGGQVVPMLRTAGPALIAAAVMVVVVPIGLGYIFGRRVLKITPVVLLGALAGAVTSGPALSLVTREARSSLPALGYTGTYALACILLTLAGTLIVGL